MRRRRTYTAVTAAVTAAAMLVLAAGIAHADNVKNNVVVGGTDTITLAGSSGSTQISYYIQPTSSGGRPGCDAADGSQATLSINPVVGVTASPAFLDFTSCGEENSKSVTLTSSTPGDYRITVRITDPRGDYNTEPASFTLHVKSGNSAPSVSVVGVADGARYEKGSVPAATCNVQDVEDGAQTFAATLSGVTGALSEYGLGSQTATCHYEDAGGLEASASAAYEIVDSTAPALQLPGDNVVAEATGASGATVNYSATASDAVDPAPAVSCAPASGSNFARGTTAVNCTATDVAGNYSAGLFNVVVQDTTKPTLSLPDEKTVEATGPAGAVVTWSATANDTVDGPIVPTCAPASGSTFELGRTPVNCSATDSSNNVGSGGFNVTVQDTTKPELDLPADITAEATGADGAAVSYSATANDIADADVPVVCSSPSGSKFGLGQTTVSCWGADDADNTAFGSFVVTVEDTTKPALELPKDITVEASKAAGAEVSFTATASDIVDGNVPVVCTPETGGTFGLGETTIECSATDGAGNTASGSFEVIVRDTTAPVFTEVPGDQTIEATGPDGATASYSLPTAEDIVDGKVPVGCTPASDSMFALGQTTVKCTASDAGGNAAATEFAITVMDTTAPEVTVSDNITAEATSAAGANVSWSGVSATDVVSGSLAAECDYSSGDVFPLGITTVECSATDGAGNTGSKSFTVSVQDTKAPDVETPASRDLEATGPEGAVATWDAVKASDAVDGDMDATCDAQSGDTFALGDTTVECTATDNAGNTGYGAFVITVRDTTAPAITVPNDFTVEATSPDGAAATYAATAVDIVDGTIELDCSPASGSKFALGANAITCTATDAAGNTSDKTFTIEIVDTTAPAITVPADKVVEATSVAGAAVDYAASASDLVDGAVTPECFSGPGTTFPLGTTEVTCWASDARGNSDSKSFKVTVQDTSKPQLNVPPTIAAMATSAAGAVVTYSATASDIVDGAVATSCSPASGSLFAPGSTTVACNATDKAGNSASLDFIVKVKFDFNGWFAPVDRNKVLNSTKAGSTVAMKWNVSNQRGGYIGDTSIVNKGASAVVSCSTGQLTDSLDNAATGATELRYDSAANQFIYNWKSPSKAGSCYRVDITFTDGETRSATFQLK